MKKLSLGIIATVLISSCGGTVKDISFQTGDYLGTGYDEPEQQKKIKISRESSKNQPKENKPSFLESLSSAVTVVDDEDEEMPDIYERSVNLTFEELDLLLKTELENANFKIVHVSHITKGVQEQGVKDFWKNMTLYMVCKLSECSKVLKHNPQLLSQFPLRVYVYEKDGKMVVGTYKPSTAIKYMGNPDADAIKALKQLDKELKKVIDTVVK
ncbi:MAG: DUF302 domain-containing protein [Hydrogenothermaceae bacterium]|nr:DUF302 domain-containing protein [Hydrogenothermaceae bacterium]